MKKKIGYIISVKEALPPAGATTIVFADGVRGIGRYNAYDRRWYFTDDQVIKSEDVTDWMMMPDNKSDEVTEAEKALWSLLDDIDTASDEFKPVKDAFYKVVMNRVGERHKYCASNGRAVFPSPIPHMFICPNEKIREKFVNDVVERQRAILPCRRAVVPTVEVPIKIDLSEQTEGMAGFLESDILKAKCADCEEVLKNQSGEKCHDCQVQDEDIPGEDMVYDNKKGEFVFLSELHGIEMPVCEEIEKEKKASNMDMILTYSMIERAAKVIVFPNMEEFMKFSEMFLDKEYEPEIKTFGDCVRFILPDSDIITGTVYGKIKDYIYKVYGTQKGDYSKGSVNIYPIPKSKTRRDGHE